MAAPNLSDINYNTIFHSPRPSNRNGCERWSVNGQIKLWKTRPGEFRIPVKHGLRSYGYVDQSNIDKLHLEADCPLRLVK